MMGSGLSLNIYGDSTEKLLDISEGDECLLLDIMENENDVFLIKLTKLDSF